MTAEVAESSKTTPAGVVFFANAEPLIRALTNGLIFSGDLDAIPEMLATLHFEFDGSTLTVTSTDRYRMCLETVELDPSIAHSGQPPFDFLLHCRDAKEALGVLRANKRHPVLLKHIGAENAVIFDGPGQTLRYTTYDAPFPDVRRLIPEEGTEVKTDRVRFTAGFLADLGKVVTARGRADHNAIVVKLYGNGKVTRIDYADGP